MDESRITAAILTISDTRRYDDDLSGDALETLLGESGFEIRERLIVSDDPDGIVAALTAFADDGIDLVLTTGGTGFSPRDNTPEATRAVIEREAPGISELMRVETGRQNVKAFLSRGISGIRNSTLIVNLPGSPKGAAECFVAIKDVLPHALRVLKGTSDH